MNRNGYIITVSISVVAILIIVSFIIIKPIISDNNELPKLEIDLDKDDIRTNELFNVTLTKDFNGKNITWDFGDGNISYGISAQHTYTESNRYNMKVTVKSDSERRSLNTSIEVINQDEIISWGIGPRQNLRPLNTVITGWNQDIYPGISDPTINFIIELSNVIGNYEIVVYIRSKETGEKTDLLKESHTWMNENVNLEYSFGSNDLPKIDQQYYYQFEIRMEEGRWNDMFQTSSVIY